MGFRRQVWSNVKPTEKDYPIICDFLLFYPFLHWINYSGAKYVIVLSKAVFKKFYAYLGHENKPESFTCPF